MRFQIVALATLIPLSACGEGPTEQEQNLSITADHPEVTANSAAAPAAGMGNPSSATGNETVRPKGPRGPVGVEGSRGGN